MPSVRALQRDHPRRFHTTGARLYRDHKRRRNELETVYETNFDEFQTTGRRGDERRETRAGHRLHEPPPQLIEMN